MSVHQQYKVQRVPVVYENILKIIVNGCKKMEGEDEFNEKLSKCKLNYSVLVLSQLQPNNILRSVTFSDLSTDSQSILVVA